MGGAVSAGEDNDELIDNLVEAEYIKSPHVERIFRAVDRGDYYLEGCKENAYRDLAWKHGNIHLSAPCIYSEVMESLKLGPGMSFLNLGSGTGYLSTMAGLVLGSYGINHGVELHDEVVMYARAKLEEFQSTSPALDKYEFCPPCFVVGNCLLLDSTCHQYDRVYCGASCPSEHENYMKNLVRVGGILVMPLNDHLLQVTRTGETTYEVKNVLPVSFASLVAPRSSEVQNFIKLPENNPLKLKEICRSAIRILLRANAEVENPSLRDKKKLVPSRRKKNRRRIRKVVIPVFDDRSESGDRNASSNEHADDEMDGKETTYSKEQFLKERLCNDPFLCVEHSVNVFECGCAKTEPDDQLKWVCKDTDENGKIVSVKTNRRRTSLDDTNEKPSSSNFRSRRGSIEDSECKKVNEDEIFDMVVKTVIAQQRIPRDLWAVQNHGTNQLEAMDTSDASSSVFAILNAAVTDATSGKSAATDAAVENTAVIDAAPENAVASDTLIANSETTDVLIANASAAKVSVASDIGTVAATAEVSVASDIASDAATAEVSVASDIAKEDPVADAMATDSAKDFPVIDDMATDSAKDFPVIDDMAIDTAIDVPVADAMATDVATDAPVTDALASDAPVVNDIETRPPLFYVTGNTAVVNANVEKVSVVLANATNISVLNANTTNPSLLNALEARKFKAAERERRNNRIRHHHTGNGDSGIDNISDDSAAEESSSDPEKTEGENGLADISASRTDCSDDNEADRNLTRLSTYLKRSAEENDDEEPYIPRIGESRITAKCCRRAVVFKRIAYSDVDSDDFDDFESDSGKESFPKDYEGTREKSDLSCYTYHMKQKINMLPLPQYLKMYLNFSRPV